jgi:dTDP-4-amino-4,6-dideoxygalactose transaminase
MILARAYYTPPLHRKRMDYPYITAELPVTDRLAERLILPPCGHLVSNEDIGGIVELFKFMRANAVEITQLLRTKAMQ